MKITKKRNDDKKDLLEIFHGNKPICQIVSTSGTKKIDTFESFRPMPFTCADYSISQTDTKLDAGPTKIHIQQTRATYEPLTHPVKVKRKRPISYFSGGPPQWKFVDEIWREKRTILQERNRIEMVKRQKRKKIIEHLQKGDGHEVIVTRVGPDWYQELSPNQICTINTLKACILKDLNDGTIDNVKENMARLGLVLRPNSKHLAVALRECCKCPVEFLLILYQLINPKRRSYSINDRLLLSSVVHLSMQSTLRELHVRIPSPPPPQPIATKLPKKAKKGTYESPYLEPYTFQREPPKFTGIYYNKHVQRPESPYFDYLPEFRKEIEQAKLRPREILEDEEDELLAEANYAQSVYEQLVDYRPVRPLLLPSIFQPCYNFKNPAPVEDDQNFEEILNPEELLEDEQATVEDEEVTKELVYVDINEDEECNESEGVIPERKSEGSGRVFDETEKISKACSTVQEEEGEPEESTEEDSEDEKKGKKLFECRKECFKMIEKPLCPCEKCENDRRRKEQALIAAEERRILREKRRMKAEAERNGEGELENELVEQEVDVVDLVENEEGEEEEGSSGSDVIEPRPACSCYEKYKKRIEEYENYQKRLNLVLSQKKQENRYVIGGVANTRDGPVYILSGIEPKHDCVCAKRYKAKLEEQRKIDHMPQIPKGRIRYGISGVKETPQGNVYMLEQAVPIEECACMQTYDSFTRRHEGCMEVYNEYMQRTDEAVRQHKLDFEDAAEEEANQFALHENEISENSLNDKKEDEEEVCEGCCEKNTNTSEVEFKSKENVDDEKDASCAVCNKVENENVVCNPCGREILDIDGNPIKKKKKKKKKPQSCCASECRPKRKIEKRAPSCTHSPCAFVDEPEPEPEPEPEEEVEEVKPPPVLKRFFIYKKMRCRLPWQTRILKKALASMAEDGYPLAKLPEAYKLPHFKLWLQMRCGKFWTQEEKSAYVLISRWWWRHNEVCYDKILTPKLKMTLEEAHQYTWRNAARVKKMTSDAVNWFYRQVRQENVNSGREFFPTMFNYEFPFWTFRDCYFSYIASKEEEVLARAVWQPYENKNKR